MGTGSKKADGPTWQARLGEAARHLLGSAPAAPAGSRPIALALQGGGSHGAFTWGVLDRLLEEESLQIEAVSGASAGAMNAAALACGYLEGGPEGAKERLAALWQSVGKIGSMAPVGTHPLSHLLGGLLGEGSNLRILSQVTSPYQFNPLDLNPLRSLVTELIDFDRLRRTRKLKLFISATNVHTGSPRLFTNAEITSDVLLASACLPNLHRAIEIDGHYYWDGGFTANPPVLPLVHKTASPDILIVHIDTQAQHDLPVSPSEIEKRLQAVLNNAPLIREIHLIGELRSAVPSGSDLGQRLRRLGLHHILPPDSMTRGEVGSKLKTDSRFLNTLKDLGRASAEHWLDDHLGQLGRGRAPDFEERLLDHSKPGFASTRPYRMTGS
ncbi:MAG: patatin-like phospholipase family protein [Kiloniellales bacterium]|nr:patatin-like phospholipase family protein [Kiloniellales bacterium]